MEEWAKKCDKHKDGKLDKEEVKPHIKKWTEGELAIEATEIFHNLDKNSEARIDKQELFLNIKQTLELREGLIFNP